MGRIFSRKHACDVETAREALIPPGAVSGGPMRTDRESQKVTAESNIRYDHTTDDIADKRL
ncbi:MAG TPA: hypothetical protein PK127_07330 [Clostridiales bacterium]|nr:hypothetical protein [Clostridiales bacterium]